MNPMSTDWPRTIERQGRFIPEATDRQRRIPGFDQKRLSASCIQLIGGGGLGSPAARLLCRQGVGAIKVTDPDVVEASNLNRQFFYPEDIGQSKAVALIQRLAEECIHPTRLIGYTVRLQDAVERGLDVSCDVALCGVDNNPTRVAVSRYYRERGIPVIFMAVSADASHGYVFVQERTGACFGCLFPDAVDDERYPCPAMPAIGEVLQLVSALAVYAAHSCLMSRPREWHFRSVSLVDGQWDRSQVFAERPGCLLAGNHLGSTPKA